MSAGNARYIGTVSDTDCTNHLKEVLAQILEFLQGHMIHMGQQHAKRVLKRDRGITVSDESAYSRLISLEKRIGRARKKS
jgi:hypothetical protein